jgi:DNA-binding XRE family transcriptional regulator
MSKGNKAHINNSNDPARVAQIAAEKGPKDRFQELIRRRTKNIRNISYLALTTAAVVKYFRKLIDVSQSELALRTALTQGRISQIESGDYKEGLPSIDLIEQIANLANHDTRLVFIDRNTHELVEFKLHPDPCEAELRTK